MMIYTLFGILLITPVQLHYIAPKTRIKHALNQFIHTGIKPAELDEAVQSLRKLNNKAYKDEQVCDTCKYVIDGVIQYRRSGIQKDLMAKLIVDLCLLFTDDGQEGCNGRVANEIDALLYMIDNRKNLTATRVCAIYFQTNLCTDPEISDWHVNIPEPLTQNPAQLTLDQHNSESRTVKLLHLTDIHFDPLYVPGSNALCDKPMCCREGTPEKPENAAGYWGDYRRCDMPWHTVLNLMDQVKKQHPDIDYVYHTGDIIDHASWSTSRSYNEDNIKRLFDTYLKSFTTVPVYPVLGNHEVHPCDYYSPENVTASEISSQWLFDLVAEDWLRWLPADTKETLKLGGYYTVLVKPGFRIIGLNSNLWYKENVWLLYDDIDPFGQLQWLADTLAEAEKNNEVVHILSHIPPGNLQMWRKHSDEFNKIIRRFAHIIKAQFNGHTHRDEIRIYLNDNKTNAINVAYNGGSFTTFIGNNPNYRIYDMDSNTYEITNYDEWIYNVTEANLDKDTPPNWYKLYSFKEAYGLNTTSMEDLFDWIQRMKGDPQKELMKQYYRYLYRESEVDIERNCQTDACLDSELCYITGVDFDNAVKCKPYFYTGLQ